MAHISFRGSVLRAFWVYGVGLMVKGKFGTWPGSQFQKW